MNNTAKKLLQISANRLDGKLLDDFSGYRVRFNNDITLWLQPKAEHEEEHIVVVNRDNVISRLKSAEWWGDFDAFRGLQSDVDIEDCLGFEVIPIDRFSKFSTKVVAGGNKDIITEFIDIIQGYISGLPPFIINSSIASSLIR